MKQVFYLNEGELAEFFSIMKDLEMSNDFDKNIIISCELCKSAISDARFFYHFIQKAFTVMSRSRLLAEKYPGMDLLYDDLAIICSYLVKACALNASGLPGEPAGGGKEEWDDTCGESNTVAYEELGIIMNPDCPCYPMITQ
jgi:hypothetical protein